MRSGRRVAPARAPIDVSMSVIVLASMRGIVRGAHHRTMTGCTTASPSRHIARSACAPTTGAPHAYIPADARRAALGRSPLLSPEPHQPVAAPAERDQLRLRLRDAVHRPRDRRADRLGLLDGDAPGWPLLLRAEGLRPREPGDARAQGSDQGRLQPAPQGGADVGL